MTLPQWTMYYRLGHSTIDIITIPYYLNNSLSDWGKYCVRSEASFILGCLYKKYGQRVNFSMRQRTLVVRLSGVNAISIYESIILLFIGDLTNTVRYGQ